MSESDISISMLCLRSGMTIQSVLASAFDFLYDMENQMNEIYAGLGDASPEEIDKLMAEAGTIQDASYNA